MNFFKTLLLICFLTYSSSTFGGILVAPGIFWGAFSFEPKKNESTPNFYGYGLKLNAGYSFSQVFDLAVFGQYSIGKKGAATPLKQDAHIIGYGGELAVRLLDSVYLAARGGAATFKRNNERRTSLPKTWGGNSLGVSIGGIIPVDRSHHFQTSLDFAHYQGQNGEEVTGSGKEEARLNQYSLTVSYVFNDCTNATIENTLFDSFLDSLF